MNMLYVVYTKHNQWVGVLVSHFIKVITALLYIFWIFQFLDILYYYNSETVNVLYCR